MERKLGERSYNPKALTPMYSGEGPNCFWDFLQSKIRQNIVGACYNDALTVQQISLETGIPLPYLDDEITALREKNILIREGNHYKSNIIIITSDCKREISAAAAIYHEKIASAISNFLDEKLNDFKSIGFKGIHFSEKSLRWMLATLVFRSILCCDIGVNSGEPPRTAWGERAYIYCEEDYSAFEDQVFAYSGMTSKKNDWLLFFDYLPRLNGNHHDFYGNSHYINIFCDLARGLTENLSEHDLEAVAEMARLGYVAQNSDRYRISVPVYTAEQYKEAVALADAFVYGTLAPMIKELNLSAERILSAHTPKHLQDQVAGISSMDKFQNGITIPGVKLIEKGILRTDWSPFEMPTHFIVLNP